jgi:hypothetical protein
VIVRQEDTPLLEVKNLRKFFPIRKGFLQRIVGQVRAVRERGHGGVLLVRVVETQLAAIRTYSDDYCWIYGHGASWWQLTPEQADQLSGKLQYFSRENYLVPVAENIDAFYEAAGKRSIIQLVPQED